MKEFKKNVKFAASAEEVYSALTKPFAIELWTGYPAKMSTEVGSEFEMWDGDICGKNLQFDENRLIRQEWYFDQEEESIVTIIITEKGVGKCEVFVKQTNIPDDMYENIVGGWEEDYLGALRVFLEEGE